MTTRRCAAFSLGGPTPEGTGAPKIDGKKVTRRNEVEVRGLPEGAVFSNDGRYTYVGNYQDRDISILRVDGDQIVNTEKSLAVPGQPASMRGRTR
jgi:hypothetical protein